MGKINGKSSKQFHQMEKKMPLIYEKSTQDE
jgi:hypothetical protein